MRTFFKYLVLQPEFSDKAITELTLADLERVTTSTVEDFLSYVSYYTDDDDHEQINGERAKARKLSTLRAFYKYFYRKERIKNNPPSLVDQPSIHDKSIIRLEPDEVARLLDAVQSGEGLTEKEKQYHKRTQARDLAILTLFLGTGIRISELVGINMDDVNFSANEFPLHARAAIRTYWCSATRLALPCSTTCWSVSRLTPAQAMRTRCFSRCKEANNRSRRGKSGAQVRRHSNATKENIPSQAQEHLRHKPLPRNRGYISCGRRIRP